MKKVRLRTILFVFLFITLMANIVMVILREDTANMSYLTAIESNKLIITGLDYGYLNAEDSFIRIISDLAYADILTNKFKLEDLDISFDNKKINVDAKAERGSYTLNKVLEATGNLNGSLNDLNFTSKKDGNIIYYYETGKGSILNGLEVSQGENMIYSDAVFFDSVNDFFFFKDNVIVNYAQPLTLTSGDNATFSGDNATFSGDNATLNGDNITLGGDNATLNGDNITLGGDNITLGGDNATLNGDNATLDGDNATLGGDNATLNGDNITLGLDNTAPSGDHATFNGDNATPNE